LDKNDNVIWEKVDRLTKSKNSCVYYLKIDYHQPALFIINVF